MRLAHLALMFAASLLPFGLAAQAPQQQLKELKVLAIGNSFSMNALSLLPKIADDGGSKLIYGHAMIGGCTLEKHAALAKLHEEKPDDPAGMPYKYKGKPIGLKELLQAEPWQVVTIQQYSAYSWKPETYQPYAKELCDYIRKYAPHAEIVMHETWAYRADNANTFKNGFTAKDMYQGLVKSYYGTAKELGIKRVIPTGDAFQIVAETKPFVKDDSFNPEKADKEHPPKQINSLNVGWFWNTKTNKFQYDHGHANHKGEYLAGLVWYETLFHGDARKIKFKPEAINEDDAKFLRSIAHGVVTEGLRPNAFSLEASAPATPAAAPAVPAAKPAAPAQTAPATPAPAVAK